MILPDGTSGGHNPSASTVTVSHTVSSKGNRLIVAVILNERPSNDTTNCKVNSVAFGGAALTQATRITGAEGSYTQNLEIWYKLAPAVSTANMVATMADANNNENIMNVMSFYNVKQEAPEATGGDAQLNRSDMTKAITTLTNGACLIGGVSHDEGATSINPLYSETEDRDNAGNGGARVCSLYRVVASPGATNFGGTFSESVFMTAAVVAAFKPVVTGGSFFYLL